VDQVQSKIEEELKDRVMDLLYALLVRGAVISEYDIMFSSQELNEVLEATGYRLATLLDNGYDPPTLVLVRKDFINIEDGGAGKPWSALNGAIYVVQKEYERLLNAYVCIAENDIDPELDDPEKLCGSKYYVIDLARKLKDIGVLTEGELAEINMTLKRMKLVQGS